MRFFLLHLFFVGLFAPITLAVYDCLDLPNVYTVEDLNAIKVDCKDAKVLASNIYPSATWIIHAYVEEDYYEWIGTIDTGETNIGTKQLRQICIITLGGYHGYGKLHPLTFTNVSGNCGESYPVDYASLYNFIDIGVENPLEECKGCYQKNEGYKHWRIEDDKAVLSNDNEPNALNIWASIDSERLTTKPKFEVDTSSNFIEHMNFPINTNNDKKIICPAWKVTASNLGKCTSIVGPLVYNGGFYGMDKIEDIEKRPYHHGCFTVENVPSTDLSFLKDLKTGSDYVDRCVGKFANVVRNSRSLCRDPKTYYAYMDPDPESEIRTAFLNSEFNKKGEFYVKMEFPEGINYDCVNKCTGDITDTDTTSPKGKYGYACKTITGSVTLIKPQWKGPALVLTITDEDEFEPILPMRLTKVTAKTTPYVILKHSMDRDRIPQRLIKDLRRIAGTAEANIEFQPLSQ